MNAANMHAHVLPKATVRVLFQYRIFSSGYYRIEASFTQSPAGLLLDSLGGPLALSQNTIVRILSAHAQPHKISGHFGKPHSEFLRVTNPTPRGNSLGKLWLALPSCLSTLGARTHRKT